VARLVRLDMRDYSRLHGWNVKFVADEGVLVINTPLRNDGGYRQYVMNLVTSGWGLWRDVPYVCGESFDGDILVGDPDGRVLRMDRNVDNVPLAGGVGDDIRWYILSSFSSYGAPALNKRAKFIRPNFNSGETQPSVSLFALYDYLVQEPLTPVAGPTAIGSSLWDTALWDVDNWNAPQLLPFSVTRGVGGMGRTFAIAMTGRSRGQDLLASWDVSWDVGGFL
jgi:hypothetical protein